MKNEFKRSLKQVRKYHYTFTVVLMVIFTFPIVLLLSFICSKAFNGYLFKYKREGLNKKGVELNTYEELAYDIQQKNINDFKIKKDQIKEINIGFLAEQVSALMIEHKDIKSTKWVISLHGFKRNKYIALRNCHYLFEKGYNILTFDSYAHGKTYGNKSDFGYTNAKILNEIILWLKNCKVVEEIGVMGVSMGAASVLQFARKYYNENKIDWAVSDCSFSGAIPQIRFFLSKYTKIYWWLMSWKINKSFERETGSPIKEVNLLKNYENIKDLKILYIHGMRDSFITYHNTVVMYHLKRNSENEKRSHMILFTNAKHSSSYHLNQEDYKKNVLEFINQK